MRCDNLNNCMHNCTSLMDNKRNLNLNPSHHTPQTLRSGGCTDLARDGKPGWFIEEEGRWSSTCWKDSYISILIGRILHLLPEKHNQNLNVQFG